MLHSANKKVNTAIKNRIKGHDGSINLNTGTRGIAYHCVINNHCLDENT